MTTLHRIAISLEIEVGTAARIIINGKAPASWRMTPGRSVRVKALLAAATPRIRSQAEFINRRQFAI